MVMPMTGNVPQPVTASPSLYNQVSSMGQAAPAPVEQQSSPQQNQAQQLIERFGTVYSDLKNLSSSYPGASAEFDKVTDALKNWLVKVQDSIVSSGGGESTTY